MNKTHRILSVFALAAPLVLAGCGGDGAAPVEAATTESAPAAETAAPATADVPSTGNVIEVKMVTDGNGNYFEPAEFTAQRGDVVRFVLESGVHNVNFPAADNPGAAGLPAPSPYLQLPGQTYDLTVDMEPGDYEYVCDPHAALGMVGTMTVQ